MSIFLSFIINIVIGFQPGYIKNVCPHTSHSRDIRLSRLVPVVFDVNMTEISFSYISVKWVPQEKFESYQCWVAQTEII